MTYSQSLPHSRTIQDDDIAQWKTTLATLESGQRLHRYLNRDLFGSESLHSIISHLRNDKGYPIEDEWVWRLDFTGKRKHVKEYYLCGSYLAERHVVLEPASEGL